MSMSALEQLSLITPNKDPGSTTPKLSTQGEGNAVDPQIARGKCLAKLGGLVLKIADFRRSESGSRVAGNPLSGDQESKAARLRGEIPESFREGRAFAEELYSNIGSAMCKSCLGRDACPFRTYKPDYNPQIVPHINPNSNDQTVLTKLAAWYLRLGTSARNNIERGKVTSVTIKQSSEGVLDAHRATAA
jgi:hypothetical protein